MFNVRSNATCADVLYRQFTEIGVALQTILVCVFVMITLGLHQRDRLEGKSRCSSISSDAGVPQKCPAAHGAESLSQQQPVVAPPMLQRGVYTLAAVHARVKGGQQGGAAGSMRGGPAYCSAPLQ